jgi:crossover junction endodeoxyribonuclease RusA
MSAAHVVCVRLPIRIISEANSRQHWRKAAARKKEHRAMARAILQQHNRPDEGGSFIITLTRIAPRVLDDDNLASGFKAARDGVADWLGIDDGSPRLSWRYGQRKSKPGEYAAEVAVQWEVAA